MSEQTDSALRGIKQVLDQCFELNYRAHGPLRVHFSTHRDDKGKRRHAIRIESGWDENYGGTVVIEASPTGKVLHVSKTEGVRVH